jgi:hypothetical protein
MVIGQVVMIHIADEAITGGRVDIARIKPIARLGYYDYTVVDKTFEMIIPDANPDLLKGLEGKAGG